MCCSQAPSQLHCCVFSTGRSCLTSIRPSRAPPGSHLSISNHLEAKLEFLGKNPTATKAGSVSVIAACPPSPDRSPLAFFTALAGLITPRGAQRNARWLAAAAPARTRTDGYLFILLYLTPLREAEQRRCSARSPAMSRSRSRQAEPRHGRRRRRVRESLDRQQHSSSS